MTVPTKRRWFRFRLSTVMILTAIAAWAMSCRPWWILEVRTVILPPAASGQGVQLRRGERRLGPTEFGPIAYSGPSCLPPIELTSTQAGRLRVGRDRLNFHLAYPIPALFAFIAWKAVWAVVERRRRQKISAPE
ncbi:MAG: hypothetical protein AB7O68_16670 [Pirellulales bacterium]